MMKRFLVASATLALLAGCNSKDEGGNTVSTAANVTAPAGALWTETVSKTAQGGIIMGNPAAPVKLIEYGALSCSHCKEFAEASSTELKTLVNKGTVSYEFRTFILGVQDLAPALLAKCGGPGPFFPLSEQIFASQGEWMGKLQGLTQQDQQQLGAMKPIEIGAFLAGKTGMIEFVQARGISADKAKACLADAAALKELEDITNVGVKDFKVQGTPTFVINGITIENTASWDALKPKLFAAGA